MIFENTIIISRILGPMFVIIAIGLLVNIKNYQRMIGDFMSSPALVYIGGVMALIFGLLIVVFHNVWEANLAVLITIFGWLGIIKGVVLLVFPNAMARTCEMYQENSTLLTIHAVIVIILGGLISYMGFFMR